MRAKPAGATVSPMLNTKAKAETMTTPDPNHISWASDLNAPQSAMRHPKLGSRPAVFKPPDP